MNRLLIVVVVYTCCVVFVARAQSQPLIADALVQPGGVLISWEQPIGTDIVAIYRRRNDTEVYVTSFYRAAMGRQAYKDEAGQIGDVYQVTVFSSGGNKRASAATVATARQWLAVVER